MRGPVRWLGARRPGTGRRPAPGRRRRSVLGTRLAGAAVVAVTGLTLAGCATARNDLGTGESGCYVALPAALDAVHHEGHLHGVLLVPAGALRVRAPLLYRAARAGVPHDRQICLVAFTGRFDATTVKDPVGRPSGRLAVVELGYPDHRVVATLLTGRQPFEFGHSHAFTL